MTLEFGKNGAGIRFGAFQKHKRLVKILNVKNDVEGTIISKAFDEQDGRGESYHLIRYNCEHYAKQIFDKIQVSVEVASEANIMKYF